MKISTGVSSLDKLLSGGIDSGAITQIFGGFGTGKSTLAQQLCITSQLDIPVTNTTPSSIFIDSEGSFNPTKLMKIATRFGLDPIISLKRILYKRVWNLEEQGITLKIVQDYLRKFKVRLIVIDNISTHIRGEFNQDLLIIRQKVLESHLRTLLDICVDYDIAGVITNQVTSGPVGIEEKFSEKPVGGNVISKYCKVSLRFIRFKDKRYAEIFEGFEETSDVAFFSIKDDGIHDVTLK